MTKTYELYERWKAKVRPENDSDAARILKLKRQTPSGWKRNGKNATADVIVRMCNDLGYDPVGWILAVEAEKKHTDTKEGRALAALAKKVLTAAAIIAIAAGVIWWTTLPNIQGTEDDTDFPEIARVQQRSFQRREDLEPHPDREKSRTSEDGARHASPSENG